MTLADMVFSPSRTQTLKTVSNCASQDAGLEEEGGTYSRVILLLVRFIRALGIANLGPQVVNVLGDVVATDQSATI